MVNLVSPCFSVRMYVYFLMSKPCVCYAKKHQKLHINVLVDKLNGSLASRALALINCFGF